MAPPPDGGTSFATHASLSDASPSPDKDQKKKPQADQGPSGPTTIESQNMDYDEKTRIAVFTGDDYGVYVKDPQFTIYCDKLTAYMRKGGSGGAGPGGKGKPSPTPSPAKGEKASGADAASSKANGLQRAVGEGNTDRPVVIVQDKPVSNGEEAQHNVGIAQKADYNADTGDIKLTGWPRVSQGPNTQLATSSSTVMIMNKDGHTMKTYGPSHSVFEEQAQPKKSGTESKGGSESPSPTLQ